MSDSGVEVRVGGRTDLADLKPYRVPTQEAAVKLNTNESPYPPPEAFLADLRDKVAGLVLHRYPDRDAVEVRGALATHLGTLTDRVWVANGTNELFMQLLLAFGGAERKAMTFEPTYAMHSHVTRVTGTRLLRGRRNPDYTLHVEATIEAIRSQRPDIVFLCSPNNPTGNSVTESELAAICEAAPGIVMLDEAYAEFAGTSFGRMVEEFDHLVVTRSFSKAWRLAGARVGYLTAQPWVIEELQKVRLPYHLSAFTQALVMVALKHSTELLGTVETIRYERDRLWRELSTTKGITAYPSDANFIFFSLDSADGPSIWQKLLDRGVLVRDFSDVQGCSGSLRVSVGTPGQDESFLEALNDALHDI